MTAEKKNRIEEEIKAEKVEVIKVNTLCDSIIQEPNTKPPFDCLEKVFENNVKKRFSEKGFEVEEFTFVKDGSRDIKRLIIKLKKPELKEKVENGGLRIFNWNTLHVK